MRCEPVTTTCSVLLQSVRTRLLEDAVLPNIVPVGGRVRSRSHTQKQSTRACGRAQGALRVRRLRCQTHVAQQFHAG